MFTNADHEYMSLALLLAERGLYTTTPNPLVGCVLVNHGQIIGQGAHLKAGEPHAEIMALRDAEAKFPNLIQGADAYVTLEPCCHFGRTPPCTDALIKAGVNRVIVAMQDPNPQVAGNGLAKLAAAGIETHHGLMEAQARELNAGFISRMTQKRPFVRVKIAASLDGKTALANGESKWITGEAARKDVQHWRARSCAILTGIGTVLADHPKMNVRHIPNARQPLRVVVDSQLRISPQAEILAGGNTLIAYVSDVERKAEALSKSGAELIKVESSEGKVCLKQLLSHLAERGINEVMVEAGQTLNGALLTLNLVDEFVFYYAPTLLGSNARGMVAIPALESMQNRTELCLIEVRQFGQDIRVRAKPISKT
ncbi:MAG: bifunctional diaminohydroxyphosphoribosylaminopyrimidine deaminase/5-amino-6-(5-phosphoribosylamino)uracil reductase RibD [Methylophilaceae bacterium]|nr:bifunctional diaminohydroxyphosphoribosylaminopyrimidine deaminase/5-amino-6-(5-phosphoribosylamino)uracil reductase RibD [Methylophilaceae bacterium]